MISLDSLGYDDFFRAAFERAARDVPGELRPARVVRQDRDLWVVSDGSWEGPARLTGQLRHALETGGIPPTVGDWVALNDTRIVAVLEQKSVLLRKAAGDQTLAQPLAANIDTVLIVGVLDGDFSPRRIERYLAAVEGSGARAVIVLSKADLVSDPDEFVKRLRVLEETTVIVASAVSGVGVNALGTLVAPRTTSVFVGSSGVGKSTLLNRLLGEDRLATQPVRARDELGRHTTTRREMLELSNGALLIDTPGLRELVPWVDEAGLDAVFDDIGRLATHCRFRDCRHRGEPGCAVADAIERGELEPDRLQSYEKQLREIRWLDRRRSERSYRDSEVTAKRKAIAKFARQMRKQGGGKW